MDPNYPGSSATQWTITWDPAANGTGAAQWFGIDWQKVSLQLGTGRGGYTLRVTVTAADCTQGGHGGYAYLDNLEFD